jgi:hypothetical protein
MKFAKTLIGGLLLAVSPLAAFADEMSYSYVGLDYIETDIDGLGPKADGFAVRGSVGFAEHYFVFAEYVPQSVANVDIDSMAVGFGGHYGLSDSLDLVGKLGWFQVDLSAPGGLDADDDGYLVEAGLRGRVAGSVELEGGARYLDLSDGGDDTSFYAAGRYHFNAMWAVGAEYRSGSDSSSWLAGVRVSF